MSDDFDVLIQLLHKCSGVRPRDLSDKDKMDLLALVCQAEKIAGIVTATLRNNPNDNNITLLDVEQVAAFLGKSTDWVKDEIKAKRLPGGLIGREYRITKAALQHYLTQRGL